MIYKRQEYNLKIIKKLEEIIEKNPQLRFCQILWNLGLQVRDSKGVDLFYQESTETFNKLFKDETE